MRRIHISAKAKRSIQRQMIWYLNNAGATFVNTMIRNFEDAFDSLATMPTIGREYGIINNHKILQFPVKRKSVVYYRYTETDLYIINIAFSKDIK